MATGASPRVEHSTALAGALSGLAFALPYLDGYLPLPPRLFAGLSGLTVAAAFVARIVSQRDFENGK